MDAYERFRGLTVFRNLEEADLKQLAGYAERREFPPGTVIIREGERGDAFYFIDSGRVSVTRNFNHETIPLVELAEGDFFGESSLIGFEPAPAMATVETREPTKTWVITRQSVERWSEKDPQGVIRFFRVLSAILSDKLRALDDAFVRLFLECRSDQQISELRMLQEKLYREWGL